MIRPNFAVLLLAVTILIPTYALAQTNTFTASTTDAEGIEMSVSNARLYWEEKSMRRRSSHMKLRTFRSSTEPPRLTSSFSKSREFRSNPITRQRAAKP